MDIRIDLEGTDITGYVLEYSREQDICTGVGTLDITIAGVLPITPNTWDKITIYEESTKVGEFNVCSYEKQAPAGTYVIACQDDSKRLQDYFIATEIQPTSPTLSRYWIELILEMAGVTYSINTSSQGEAVSMETQFGVQPAYDSIMTLLQLSGWYMYFDDDGTCQIGELAVGISVTKSFDDSEIITTTYRKSDKMMRNRVVVWGASDPESGWVWSEVQAPTEWDRDDGEDYRTVVYSNSAIQSTYNANIIANKILNEFSQTIPVKEVVVAGFYPQIQLGDKVASTSAYNPFSGKVTGIIVNVGQSGVTTTITIDERCPRMFGYAYVGDGWIYIGTDGEGIWRKQFTGSTWYDYSDGITDLRIKDLAVYDNILACVTATTGDLYLRLTSQSQWTKYIASGFVDSSDPENPITVASGVLATACSIDRTYETGGSIVASFTLPGSGTPTVSGLFPSSGNKSWVRSITADSQEIYTHQVYIPSGMQLIKGTTVSSDCYDIGTVDIETNDVGTNIVSVQSLTNENYVVSGRFPGFIFGSFKQRTPAIYVDWGLQNQAIAGKDFFTTLPPAESGVVWPSSIIETGVTNAEVIYAERSPHPGSIGNLYIFDVTATTAKLYVKDRNWNGPYNVNTVYDFSGSTLNGCHPHKLIKIGDTTFNLFVDKDSLGTAVSVSPILYRLDTSDLSVTVLETYPAPNGYSAPMIADNPEEIFALPGGVFCAIAYTDAAHSNGDAPHIVVRTFNIETGAYTDKTYTGTSLDWEDWATGIIGYDDTPNYLLAAFAATIDGGVQYTVGENFWEIIILTINKYTGETNLVNSIIPMSKVADETGWWMYGAGHVDVDGIRSIGSYRVNSQIPFVRGWDESIDYGLSIGKIYVPIQAETIVTSFEDYYSHNIAYLFTVNINACSIISTEIYPGILHYVDDAFSWYQEQQAPAWLLEPGLDWSTDNNPLFVAPRLIQAVYSRNTLDTPVIFGALRIDRDTPDIVQAAASKQAPDGNYSVLDFSDSGMSSLCHVSSLVDDIDNTIYFVACSGFSKAKTAGMNFGGKLTKIEQTSKAFRYAESILQSHMIYNGVVSVFQYWPSGILVASGGGYKVLTHNPTVPSGEFTVLYNWEKELYLDTGRGTPTTIYDKPYSGGDVQNSFSAITSTLATTYQNTAGSLTVTLPDKNIYDARLFDIADNEFFPYSGEYPPSLLTRYIGIADKTSDLLFIDSELTSPSGFLVITQFPSGVVTHLDFTNYVLDPYIFCTVDTPASGQQFFQRNTEETYFLSKSINLPTTPVTIIRVDDNV